MAYVWIAAYDFRKNILEHKKTTPRRQKQKSGSRRKNKI